MFFNLEITIYAIIVAFIIGIILCPLLIPLLHKLKFGQMQREDGPKSHMIKSGTPTMGGLAIILAIIISSLLFLKSSLELGNDGVAILIVTIGFGIIGFLDDYIKVVKKRNLGLKVFEKLFGQAIITIAFLYYIYNFTEIGTDIYIPFTNGVTLELGYLFIPFIIVTILGTVNGVNLTDGMDGLATGVTLIVSTFFLIIALVTNSAMTPIIATVVGGLLSFLIFNAYPAKVFMGDTGSLALGGFVVSTAILFKMPLFILIVGIIYLLESLSVIIQVLYYKKTKKRFFKMAPLHHHFEESGYSETSVTTLFFVVTAMFCLIGFLGCKFYF